MRENQKSRKILEQHSQILTKGSAVSPDVIRRANILSASEVDSTKLVGFKHAGIVFPYSDLGGTPIGCRIRFDVPPVDGNGRVIKYAQPKGSDLTCYFMPDDVERLKDYRVPLLITEGEKKLLALESISELRSYAKASMPGCWNFKKKGYDILSDEWQTLILPRRLVSWIPDTDYFANPNVTKAGDRFLSLAFKAGATIRVVDLREHAGATQ